MNYAVVIAIIFAIASPALGIAIHRVVKVKPFAKYGVVNILTGVVTRHFWTRGAAVRYVFKPRKLGVVGTIRPYDFFARPAKLTRTPDGIHAEVYEFANGI